MTQRTQGKQKPLAAGFSIAAGVLIIISSIMVWQMMMTAGSAASWLAEDSIRSVVTSTPFIPLAGLASGFIVLLAGVMMYARPQNKRIWGVMALIFSVLSLMALGGFLLGTGLGVIGGILAVANRQVGR